MSDCILPSAYIDAFFAKWPAFDYDSSRPIVAEFHRMARHLGWKNQKRRQKRKGLCKVVGLQFEEYYGIDPSDIDAWRSMCIVLGVDTFEIPDSLTKCRKMVKSYHVNIYDYVEAKRRGGKVRIFRSLQGLANYSYEADKVFPLHMAKQGGVLAALLKPISQGGEQT